MTYVVTERTGQAFMLNDSRIVNTVYAAVEFEDGRVVWSGRTYRKGDQPRGFKLPAHNMAKRYNAYLARTGKRFEIEQDEIKAAKRAEADAERKRKKAVQAEAEAMLDALREFTGAVDAGTAFADQSVIDLARAILARIDGAGGNS